MSSSAAVAERPRTSRPTRTPVAGAATAADGPGTLLVTLKTRMSAEAVSACVPFEMTVAEVLARVQSQPPRTPEAARTLQFIRDEARGDFSLLARGADGRIVAVPPETKVGDVAVAREVRTPGGGVESRKAAALTVQAYQKVGA